MNIPTQLLALVMCAFVHTACKNAESQQSTPALANSAKKLSTAVADTTITGTPVAATVNDDSTFQKLLTHITNGDSTGKWPVKTPTPLPGSILPYNRVIAYYGNLYSTRMGALGEYPRKEMQRRLMAEVAKWQKADPAIPAIPALHYICVTAQGSPGAGGKYRLRMPFHQIDSILSMAKEINAIVFLDVQVALSNLETELPLLEKYLSMPNVHLGIDPEFSMKGGQRPGTVVGTFDAADVNYTTNYLKSLVKKNNLPPKILVLHRFTQRGFTNYKNIKLNPEVQIVMHMDGWGEAARKINTYKMFVHKEPVEYTGFKVFYKNDTKKVRQAREMQPEQLMKLKPLPVYIQYQ
jgi:hypothetical protein